MTFSAICHWHHHCVMPMALSIVSLYSLGKDDLNNVQHNVFGHVMALALALLSDHAKSVINDSILFVRSRWSKYCVTGLFGHVMALALVLASHVGNGTINGTTTFLRSRQLK